MEKTTNGMFNGTVDQLLGHCATLDLTSLNDEVAYENFIEGVMRDRKVDRKTALGVIESAKQELWTKALNELMNEGIFELCYNGKGEPEYRRTAKPYPSKSPASKRKKK